ncbi:MAG: hypothetical protein QGH20_04180 [Candidatus Latescibacteria bacterium]|nr:hypothetical protein [Candidatus Latescibacterota bacterium]
MSSRSDGVPPALSAIKKMSDELYVRGTVTEPVAYGEWCVRRIRYVMQIAPHDKLHAFISK